MARGEVMRRFLLAFLTATALAAQNADSILDLEKKVAQDPANTYQREQLVRAYNNLLYNPGNGPLSLERVRAGRREHITWLIEHQPMAWVLNQPDSRIEPKGGPFGDPEGYAEAARLWKQQAEKPDARVETRAHAALFFAVSDRGAAYSILDPVWRAYPRDPLVSSVRATIDAYEMLGVIPGGTMNKLSRDSGQSAGAEKARTEVDKSDTVTLYGHAGRIVAQVAPNEPIAQEAEKWLKRAIQIEPTNQNWNSALPRLYWAWAMNSQGIADKLRWMRQTVACSAEEVLRGDFLLQLANAELDAGQLESAGQDARAALNVPSNGWNRWNIVNRAHSILGRIALQQGKPLEARSQLLESARMPADARNYGPDMRLAQALLDSGERDAVLQYLEMCRRFSNEAMIDRYITTVKNDPLPSLMGPRPAPRLKLAIGAKPPDFRLKDLDGKEWTRASLEGKVVAIDFWATWCGPCRDEMPALSNVAKKIAERGAVLISIDANEKEDVVRRFVSMNPVAFPVLLADEKTVRSFELDGYPTLMVLDKTGKIAYNLTSAMSEESLLAAIEKGFEGAKVLPRLPAPEMLTPLADAVFDIYPRRTQVTWKPVEGAASYVVEWDFRYSDTWNSQTGNGVMARSVSRANSSSFDFVGAQPGRVRVVAIGADGNAGEPSAWREFRYTR